MAYKVLDIYKDLPLTNCGDCGRGSCFAFASAVYLEGVSVSDCPHLSSEKCADMEAKLAEGKAKGEGKRPAKSEQALSFLRGKMAEGDLAEMARKCGAEWESGPPEALLLDFLTTPHRISRDEVEALQGEQPTVWVKIFLLIYATRATGAPAAGQWVAYRELPNTVSKSKSFEANPARLAEAFDGKPGELDAAARRLEGRVVPFGSADRAYVFRALPRVDLLLLYWNREDEFPARVALLLDRAILEYLDQEAIVFLAEAFTSRLLGQDLAEVIP